MEEKPAESESESEEEPEEDPDLWQKYVSRFQWRSADSHSLMLCSLAFSRAIGSWPEAREKDAACKWPSPAHLHLSHTDPSTPAQPPTPRTHSFTVIDRTPCHTHTHHPLETRARTSTPHEYAPQSHSCLHSHTRAPTMEGEIVHGYLRPHPIPTYIYTHTRARLTRDEGPYPPMEAGPNADEEKAMEAKMA